MASTNLEYQGHYIDGYLKLLDTIRYAKVTASPETAEVLNQVAREHREWVRRVAQIDDLPEVPKE